jgi:phosphatidylserine/phosphatidylglycerophosphate/cardiolipin synthase-like enzyme
MRIGGLLIEKRSFALNDEVNIAIPDRSFAERFEQDFNRDSQFRSHLRAVETPSDLGAAPGTARLADRKRRITIFFVGMLSASHTGRSSLSRVPETARIAAIWRFHAATRGSDLNDATC